MSFEHVPLDVDGEVAEPTLLPLTVQAVQHRGPSAGEADLHHRAGDTGGRAAAAAAAAAAHLHGLGLHLWGWWGGEEAVRTQDS